MLNFGKVARQNRYFSTLLLAAVLPNAAQTALLDVTVTGTVDTITNATLASQFSIGQVISAAFTYDSNTPGTSGALPPVYTTSYSPAVLGGGSFSIGSYSGGVGPGLIRVTDNEPTDGDAFIIRALATAPDIGAFNLDGFFVSLADPTGTALNDRSLPASLADLSGFNDQRWGLGFGSCIGVGCTPPGVLGPLTSLTITERTSDVPVPATLALLLVGLYGMQRRISACSIA